jgi:hypothetical protein
MRLEKKIAAFRETREALMAEMEALDPPTLLARPFALKWSILEILEHLVLAERAVFKGLKDPARLEARERRFGDRVRYELVLFILKSGIRVRVPAAEMAPRGDQSLRELRRRWDENEAWLGACIDHLRTRGLRERVFEHPVAGPLSVEEAVVLGHVHLDAHARQIHAVLRATAAGSKAK